MLGTAKKKILAIVRNRRTYVKAGEILFFALVVTVLVHVFFVQPFIVSGNSMVPAYTPGDYLIIDRLSYRFSGPQRGDVIVFHYPLDPSLYFIKRIDAVPGETVGESTGDIATPPSGSTQSDGAFNALSARTLTLADGEYFVLGDNRAESSDSRLWGPLQKKFIVGRVMFRLWPLPGR